MIKWIDHSNKFSVQVIHFEWFQNPKMVSISPIRTSDSDISLDMK